MKILIIFTIFYAFAFAEIKIEERFLKARKFGKNLEANVEVERRIVGGLPVTRNIAPFFTLLFIHNSADGYIYVTGGTLIRHDFILTSAAIVSPPMIETHAYLGIHTRSTQLEMMDIYAQWYSKAISPSAYYPHPQYNNSNFNNNIGLLRIPLTSSTLGSLGNVSAIQLPRPEDAANSLVGLIGSAFGFGMTEDFAISFDLRRVNLTVISNEDCAAVLPQYVNSNVFCTRNEWATSVCAGDEGGPFVGNLGGEDRLVGIVSFSALLSVNDIVSVPGCNQGIPGTFVRVANYLDWISATLETPPRDSAPTSVKLSLILSFAALLAIIFK